MARPCNVEYSAQLEFNGALETELTNAYLPVSSNYALRFRRDEGTSHQSIDASCANSKNALTFTVICNGTEIVTERHSCGIKSRGMEAPHLKHKRNKHSQG
jgi:hypothetical protein